MNHFLLMGIENRFVIGCLSKVRCILSIISFKRIILVKYIILGGTTSGRISRFSDLFCRRWGNPRCSFAIAEDQPEDDRRNSLDDTKLTCKLVFRHTGFFEELLARTINGTLNNCSDGRRLLRTTENSRHLYNNDIMDGSSKVMML